MLLFAKSAYHFKQRGLGRLVGKRTWGGLVGIGAVPPLVDGGAISVPSFGAFSIGAMGECSTNDVEMLTTKEFLLQP